MQEGGDDDHRHLHGLPGTTSGEAEPLVVLGLDRELSDTPTFTRDGALAAWGNADGSVTVCRLGEVRARLDRLGLGWRGPP